MQTPISLNTLEHKGVALNALVNEMMETFPPVTPTPSDQISHIMFRAGQRSVVEWVINKLNE